MVQSVRWRGLRARSVISLAVLTIFAACSSAQEHRVRASGDAARQLLARGGTLIQDYGTFQVISASPAVVASMPAGAVDALDGRILLNAGPIDPAAQGEELPRTTALPAEGNALHLVQLIGPVRPEWYAALVATGVRIITYIPNDAYLVYGDAAALTRLTGMARQIAFVRWDGAYLDAFKLDQNAAGIDTGAWSVQLVEDPDANAVTRAAVALVETAPTRSSTALGYVNLVVRCDAASAAGLASRPDVVSIQPYLTPVMVDERQDVIVSGNLNGGLPNGAGYLAWLAGKGFTQAQFTSSGFGVDLSDSGIDNGTTTPNHFAFYAGGDVLGTSRVAYNRLVGTPSASSTIMGCDGHGNLNAHIVAGYANGAGAPHVDAQGYQYGLGVAPFVKVGSSVVFDPSFTYPSYESLQARAWGDGMRVSSNSWGANINTYTVDAQRYDALVRDAAPAGSVSPLAGNQEMAILFAAGNAGSASSTVGNPGTAKNVITVGGTENARAFGGADACGVTDSQADSAQDLATFSSRGPCSDGRKKPDLVAPATHVTGGVAQADGQRANPPASGTGAALGCFDASSVCGGVGSNYVPAGQQWYTASSGTSHSTPAVAGAAALVRQYFLNHAWSAPSPAMTKAYLMNSARYLTGAGANDTLPSNAQGMGLLDLGMAFDGVARQLSDQEPQNLFTATAETRTFGGWIAESTRPFRVTLAWTDAPGSTTGSAWKNNLDLSVTVGGVTYKGNVFAGASSVAGGSADTANNVESVFLPAGASGAFTVTVTAANVNSDGVPGNASPLDQDFALVVYNVCTTPPPAAPTGVSATVNGSNRVDVAWTPNGAATYRIFRSTVSGGPYTQIGAVSAPPYQDLAVSGGATYYYVVRAADCSESVDSAEVSALATGVCTSGPVFSGLATAASAGTATCGVSLGWSAATAGCGGTLTYDVHRSLVPAFVPGNANRIATGVNGTAFADTAALQGGVTYYYLVRAVETGAAMVSDANTVVRTARSTGASTTWFDDFNANRPANAASYWIATTEAGTAGTLNLVSACRYQSSNTAWRFGAAATTCGGSYPSSIQATLSLGGNGTLPGVNGFAVGAGGTLTFNQWYLLESGWDGAWLVYSTVSAAGPWIAIPDSVTPGKPFITAGLYDQAIIGTTNRGWSSTSTGTNQGANGALRQVSVNLDALAGQTVWIGWKFRSDSSISYEGFYLDDVRLDLPGACTTSMPPPGPAVSFTVSLPGSTAAGTATPFTVVARDVYGQTATSYGGSAVITSSDGQAVLPAPLSFSSGVANGSIELRTAGTKTVTATGGADPALLGSASTNVTAGAPAQLHFGVQPSASTAGNPIAPPVKVRISDVFGNPTSATDLITVALGAAPGGATLGGTLTVAAVAGVATFPGLVLQKAATGYTLVASGGACTGATSTAFDVAASAPATLAFVQEPGTTVAGDAVTPAPSIAILDAFGNRTPSVATVTVGLAADPGGATLSGTSTVAAVDGVATFTGLSFDRVASGYRLGASSAGLASASSAAFAVTPAVPHHLAFVQMPADIIAGEPYTPVVSAQVLDRFGNRAPGHAGNVTLAIDVNPTAATIAGTTSVLATDGLAAFPGVTIQRAGAGYALSASATGLAKATSTPFHVRAGAVSKVLFAAQPIGSAAGASLGGPPAAYLADAFGNVQPDATGSVTLALGANPGGGTLSGVTTASVSGGVASFPALSIDKAAEGYTLEASSPGAAVATSAAFDVRAGAATALEFVRGPGPTPAHAPIDPVPTVRVRDAYGNTVSGSTAPVTLAIETNPAAGTLAGPLVVAATGGIAGFPGLSIDAVGSGYALRASADGLGVATSATFDVGVGSLASLAFVAQPTGAQAGSTVPPVTVELRDAWGTPTASTEQVLLGFATSPGNATLAGTRIVAAVNGVATFSDLSIDRAGAGFAFMAVVAGLPVAISDPFDVAPGAVARYVVTGLPAATNAHVATAFGLVAYDLNDNVATGYSGTATFTSSDPSAALPGPATFAGGLCSGLEVTFNAAGAHSVVVTDAAVPTIQGEAAVVVVGGDVRVETRSSGCGCSAGTSGDLGLLLTFFGLGLARLAPRRRRGGSQVTSSA